MNLRIFRGKLLHDAVQKNNVQEIKRLLSAGVDVNCKNNVNFTPLHIAAHKNQGNSHFEAIKLLLENGANVNELTSYNITPLYCLAKKADVEVVKLLLNYGADVNLKNQSDEIPLRQAIEGGNDKVVQLLLDRGSDTENVDSGGFTLLHRVSIFDSGSSHFKIAELLLNKGADVNAQDMSKETPLHHLMKKANLKIVQLFLDFKANVNIKNFRGEIPLFYALKSNNKEVVQLLLDLGFDINSVSSWDGSTLLHTACKSGCSVKIVKSLLNKGLDVNALDYEGKTPLMVLNWVAPDHVSSMLNFLLKYSDTNIVDLKGNNVLDFEDGEFVRERILEHVAKIHALDISLHPSILVSISKNKAQESYFKKRMKELAAAKNIKLKSSWVTFFNLLIDGRKKLKNYAGNEDLIEDFKNSDYRIKFPIYGPLMEKNISKGIQMRKFFDDSTEILSDLLPIFNPTHLVITDILDHLQTKDLFKLCGNV